MNMAATKWFGLVGLMVLASAFSSMAGCAGSKDEGDDAAGGSASGGSDSGSGGASTNSGGATVTGSSSTSGVTCAEQTVVPNALLTDFSEVTAGTYNGTSFDWGTTTTLTGGSFFYDGDGDDTTAVLTVTIADAAAAIAGTIGTGSYAGFGFWFGPACNDASAYSGFSFSLKGTAGNAQIQVQMQSSRNYPVDSANAKGECTGTWSSGCASNSKTLDVAISADTATTVKIPWSEFTGGAPIDPLDPGELLGVQWHFNCGEDGECTPSVVIDDVTFY